jgi:hypothetical protein
MNLEELEQRVIAIEDLENIKKLHQNYINLMDHLKYREVLDVFTEDASVEVRNSGIKHGKKAIEDIYLGILAKIRGNNRTEAHFAVEPDITVNGNTANGTWLIYMLFSKPTIQWVQGVNQCEYRKEKGEWKISKLKFMRTLASDPSFFP